jgi:hypothetical protein
VGFVKRHIRWIDKHFCILLMLQKFDALRHRAIAEDSEMFKPMINYYNS